MTNTINDPYDAARHYDNAHGEQAGLETDIDNMPIATGKDRVIRLVLIALFFLVVAGVIIFGLIPYIEHLNQPTAPPLPPAIHA